MTRRQFTLAPAALQLATPQLQTLWPNLDGRSVTWFHPRVCLLPGPPPRLLMTLQTISGSDVYGPVHVSYSEDNGFTWSTPEPIPGYGRRHLSDGSQEGFCDTVPEFHPQSGAVIAMAQNVFYLNERLTRPNEGRYPVYMIRRPNGAWGPLRKLDWPHPEATAVYMSNCAQRHTLPSGDVLVPMSFSPTGRLDRAVTTVRCSFDGETLTPRENGRTLRLSAGRGLLEPSITQFQNRFLLTIRAENLQGFVSASPDGLAWDTLRPWTFDDGEPLVMSTTQQRWIARPDALYLVYTRKHPSNAKVTRWRAPLFIAQLDPQRLCLLRHTERIAIPLYGDPENRPNEVEHLGNFHASPIANNQTLITTGSVIPANYRGALHFARLH